MAAIYFSNEWAIILYGHFVWFSHAILKDSPNFCILAVCGYFQIFGEDFNGIWSGEICEYADFFNTFRRAVYIGFTTTKTCRTPKTGLLHLCLFKQNNISKEWCLKTRQQSCRPVGKKKDVHVRECNLIPMSISPLLNIWHVIRYNHNIFI